MGRFFLLIAVGGAIGGIARYLITVYFIRFFPSPFPYGTFIVNISGCLLIGIFYGLSERFDFTSEWRIFLTTGLCGGFTTFSAFAYENIRLLQTEQYFTFALYSTTSFLLSLLAVLAGLSITKVFTA